MSLINFRDWLAMKESSPATRSKTAAALGLGPDVADVFGHATPPPWQVEKLTAKRRNKKKKASEACDDESIEEKVRYPDYTTDKLYNRAKQSSKTIDDEIETAEQEIEDLEQDLESRRKRRKPAKRHSDVEQDDDNDSDADADNDDVGNDSDESDEDETRDDERRKTTARRGSQANPRTMEEVWNHLFEQSQNVDVSDGVDAGARQSDPESIEETWDHLLAASEKYLTD